jgi:hypothetical protein
MPLPPPPPPVDEAGAPLGPTRNSRSWSYSPAARTLRSVPGCTADEGGSRSSCSLLRTSSRFSPSLWSCQHPSPNVAAHSPPKKPIPAPERPGGGGDAGGGGGAPPFLAGGASEAADRLPAADAAAAEEAASAAEAADATAAASRRGAVAFAVAMVLSFQPLSPAFPRRFPFGCSLLFLEIGRGTKGGRAEKRRGGRGGAWSSAAAAAAASAAEKAARLTSSITFSPNGSAVDYRSLPSAAHHSRRCSKSERPVPDELLPLAPPLLPCCSDEIGIAHG